MATENMEIRVPNGMELQMLYINLYKSLCHNVVQKIKDSNSMRSNLADPHLRTIVIPDVPKIVFAGAFGSKMLLEEKCLEGVDIRKSSPTFKIWTLQRMVETFSPHIVRCQKSGDISIISPWFICCQNTEDAFLDKGKLLLPIKKVDDKIVKCFIPCGGFDADTDTIPEWVTEVKITDIISDIDANKELFKNLIKRAEGKLTAVRKTNYASIPSGQVAPGDFVVCRAEWKEVYCFTDDAFYPEGKRDIVRFRMDFNKNINKQPFNIVKIPRLQGKIVDVEMKNVNLHQEVQLRLDGINVENMGNMKVTFKKCMFQQIGFFNT